MQVKNGLLDRILTRPRSVTLQVLCSDFIPAKIGRLTEAIILLIYGIFTIDVSFWTIEGMEAMNIISDGGREVSSYPINIYVKWFANIFTFLIPFGMVNYYPLQYLLGRVEVPFWYGLAPITTLVFMAFSFLVWKIGLTQYSSTGS